MLLSRSVGNELELLEFILIIPSLRSPACWQADSTKENHLFSFYFKS